MLVDWPSVVLHRNGSTFLQESSNERQPTALCSKHKRCHPVALTGTGHSTPTQQQLHALQQPHLCTMEYIHSMFGRRIKIYKKFEFYLSSVK